MDHSNGKILGWVSLVAIPVLTVALGIGANYFLGNIAIDLDRFKYANQILNNKDSTKESRDWALKIVSKYYSDYNIDVGSDLKYIKYYSAILNKDINDSDFIFCYKPSEDYFKNGQDTLLSSPKRAAEVENIKSMDRGELIKLVESIANDRSKLITLYASSVARVKLNCDGLKEVVDKLPE